MKNDEMIFKHVKSLLFLILMVFINLTVVSHGQNTTATLPDYNSTNTDKIVAPMKSIFREGCRSSHDCAVYGLGWGKTQMFS